MKSVGKPDARNGHVRFDERGRETGRLPVGSDHAPFLDSTGPHGLAAGGLVIPRSRGMPQRFAPLDETPLWICDRVAHLIAQEFDVSYHAGHVWKILRQLNWSVQRPPAGRWNATKPPASGGRMSAGPRSKEAQTEGRTIVFIDENGLSQRPHHCRT